jgi:CRISPR-associated endonuclease/helicase Cas3
MLDVAATAEALLVARPLLRERLTRLLGLDSAQLVPFLVWLAAIHDIGKFAWAFQWKMPELCGGQQPPAAYSNLQARHDADGRLLWETWLGRATLVERICRGASARSLGVLIDASVCHHGEPALRSGTSLKHDFGPGAGDAEVCRDALLELLLPHPVDTRLTPQQAKDASHWVAGLVTVADWLGSSQRWFPYASPDLSMGEYWQRTRENAERAVHEAGLVAPRSSVSGGFERLTGKTGSPTPLQAWALNTPLPPGPVLFILEDVTGAGKTEAAHILVHRLMADGRASGAWWAMPTMATANAMYARQAKMLAGLFDTADDVRPSLALSHGQARLHEGFRASRADWTTDEPKLGEQADGLTASAACAAFLADDRRLSLLADVGAGTIDQAVLAVLPSRFNTVRLLGLAEKVLVVDEVHAHDPYVTEELLRLLEFHRAQGGSAILLSATLTNRQREKLIRAWRGPESEDEIDGWNANEARYPLATVTNRESVKAEAIAPAPWSHRSTPVERIETPEAVLERLRITLEAGGCAAWVRNTVDDVLAAADMARAHELKAVVFHARFAQWDRQRIEEEVMCRFGPRSTREDRRGGLVIASQVIEQSLDLDFDQLASDLAPIDLLLQRAGRMRRHQRQDRPEGIGDAMLVLAPPPVEDAGADWLRPHLAPTGAVYRDHAVLWRTTREIERRGRLTVPDDVRDLVETVHASDACPEGLIAKSDAAEGEHKASAQLAQNQVLELKNGYTADQPYQSELRISTRNAEAQLTIRLAKRNSVGAIVPWADHDGPDWKAWALSEVRVRPRTAPLGARTLPELQGELAPIIKLWGRFEQDIPVCLLEPDGDGGWRGQLINERSETVTLYYSPSWGLSRRF